MVDRAGAQGLPRSWAPFGTLVGDDERMLARTMAAYWTNFARAADPNLGVAPRTPMSIEWPRAGAGSTAAIQLGLPALSTVAGRSEQQCAFVDSLGYIPMPVEVLRRLARGQRARGGGTR